MTDSRRRLTAALAAALASLALLVAGCANPFAGSDANVSAESTFEPGTTMDRLHDAGKIKVGVKFDMPGGGYKPPGAKEPTGFDIEIAKIIASRLGIAANRIQWIETVAKDREAYLRNRTVDLVVASYSITDERRRLVGMAGPYYTTGQQLLVRKDDDSIAGPQDIKDRKVCAVSGSTSIKRVEDRYRATPIPFATYTECVEKLLNGSVDAVTADGAILLGYAGQHPKALEVVGEPFSTERYGIGFRKGDTAMCEFLSGTLNRSFRDGTWDNALFDTLWKTSRSVPDHPTLDRCS